MQGYKFAGYRIQEFSSEIKANLKEIANRLVPHKDEIVDNWIKLQYRAWAPPGFSRRDLRTLFDEIYGQMLARMTAGELELCIDDMEQAGAYLAQQDFPYEALMMSIHFLEESYLKFLLNPHTEKTMDWLIGNDEFQHAVLAAIATSYFQVYRKKLLEEAEVGRIVQESLLPDIPRRIADLEVGYVYIPAMSRGRVGGDLVDLFACDEAKTAMIVGDLSGHGLEAAADSVMVRSLFRGYNREGAALPEIIQRINKVLFAELAAGKFVTAMAATYDGAGTLSLVSAGHPSPIYFNGACNVLEPDGIALAVDEDAEYVQTTLYLANNDLFVAYTDGLIEARSKEGFFGEKRVLDIVSDMQGATARAVAEELRDSALRFAGGTITDDVAILVLRRVNTP